MHTETLLEKFNEVKGIQYGDFLLKSGQRSSIYIDLRVIVSYPELLKAVSEKIWEKIQGCRFDKICGVPYTALPIATAISLMHNCSMVLCRKEAKEHGLKKRIEGHFQPGQECVIIEDVVTSGGSILETIAVLENEGLKVNHVVTFIDRDQGGKANLKAKGYTLHSVYTLPELLKIQKGAT